MNTSTSFGTHTAASQTKDLGFSLSNGTGAFCCFGIESKYRGWFVPVGGKMLKILDDIQLHPPVSGLRNENGSIALQRGPFSQRLLMPEGVDGLACALSSPQEMKVLFDVKHPYDQRQWGREYAVAREGKHLLVSFIKRADSREDPSSGAEEYKLYIAVSCNGQPEIVRGWAERRFPFDERRNSPPFSRFVFHALTATTDTLVLGVGSNAQEAIHACEKTERSLKKMQVQHQPPLLHLPDHLALAAQCASDALSGLIHDSRIYAGLPWFFQEWSRDTLISVRALILKKKYALAKEILLRYLKAIQPDGTLLSKEGGIVSADAFGWLCLRLEELLSTLEKQKAHSRFFKRRELEEMIELLEKAASGLFQRHTQNHLATCENKTTWMDSIDRGASPIELQAQRLRLYDVLYRLTKKKVYADLKEKLLKKTRQLFWHEGKLRDSAEDGTIRPNIFLAAYIYPNFLSAKEWERCFDKALPRLWLPWGGLATIDKTDRRYRDRHTGERPESYHNGDSWYWLNNLAALVLHRLNARKYKKYVDAITNASVRDILWQGFSGAHSELSSAAEQEPGGCLNQAWSDALFLELAFELADKRGHKHFK